MVKENLKKILSEIDECTKKAGRKAGSVRLLAVSKFHPSEAVTEAISEGQLYFGENRVQEAHEKFLPIVEKNKDIELHIIGSLQTNKVKKAIEVASVIESVDRLDLIKEIEKQCSKLNKNVQIYFEIHTGEESKSGYTSKEDLISSLDFIKNNNAPHVIPKGFMTMAPLTNDETLIRKSFSTLRNIRNEMQELYPEFSFTELSMGMSSDFKIAIEEGSTEVRVGTAIFGERDYSKK